MPLQVLAADKSQAAEQEMFEVLRAIGPRERSRLASRHNDNAYSLMRQCLSLARVGCNYEELSVEWARIQHGESLQALLRGRQSLGSASTWALNRPRMDEPELHMLSRVTRALNEVDAQWFVGGSMAACANGYGRPHRDVDIIAPGLSRERAKYLQASLGDEFFCCEAEVNGSAALNFVHLASAWTVDVFTPALENYEHMALERRCEVALFGGDVQFWIESPCDSILSRLRWTQTAGQHEQAWDDAVGMMKVHSMNLDFDYLDWWARDLGVTDLLEKALDEAGLNEKNG